MLRVFGKELFGYLPAQIVPLFLAFISIPVYTRILSAEEYGQYTLIMSSVSIMVILNRWLTTAVIRFYPSVPEQETAVVVRTSFWSQLVLASLLGLMAFILTHVFWTADVALQRLAGIGILIMILQSVFYLLVQVLRARLQAGIYSLFMIWDQTASLGISLLLAIGLHLGTVGILWGSVLSIAIALPYLWRMVFTRVQAAGPISFPLLLEMAKYGIPLAAGQMGAWGLNQADRYLIQAFHGTQAVGIYSVAHTVSNHGIGLLNTLFRLSSTPLLAQAWEKQGEEVTRRLLDSVTRLYLVISIPMVAGISILAEPTIKVIAGADFSSGHAIIPWVASGAFFTGLEHRFNQALLLFKRSGITMFWLIACGLLNVALNWWLLPLFSYKVAAVTALASHILLCVTQAWSSRQYLHWSFPWWTALRSLLAAVTMAIGISFLLSSANLPSVWALCIAIPVGVLIYGSTMWALGEFSAQERKSLEIYARRWLTKNLRTEKLSRNT